MAFGMSGYGMIGAGGQAFGGAMNFLESRNQAQIAETQGSIERAQIERARKKTVGKAVAQTGGAGIELSGSTLEQINDTNTQFYLDELIAKQNADLASDAIKRKGTMDLIGGVIGGAGTAMQDRGTQSFRAQMLKQNKQTIGAKTTPQSPVLQGMPIGFGYGGTVA